VVCEYIVCVQGNCVCEKLLINIYVESVLMCFIFGICVVGRIVFQFFFRGVEVVYCTLSCIPFEVVTAVYIHIVVYQI
jgi:hypothetical protein